MSIMALIAGGGVLLLVGIGAGYFIRQIFASRAASSVEYKIKTRLEEAEEKSRALVLDAEKRAADILAQSKNDERDIRGKLEKQEGRILDKQEELDKRLLGVQEEKKKIEAAEEKIKVAERETEELRNRLVKELERAASLTEEDARKEIIAEIEKKYREEFFGLMQKLEREKDENLEKKGLELITTAVQRYARSHVSELTTSVFHIPNEEFKGKIIGREGRNIRTLERETGVEFIMDETPDAIIISSFDPLRREIARLALEKLVKDGRIQPAKIEEKVE